MKNTFKALTAGIAAVIASAAMVSTASAATYVDCNGNIYNDGVNDGIVCYQDYDGSIYAYQDDIYYYSSHDFYQYYTQYYYYPEISYDRYIYQSGSYIGEDAFYGSIYYDQYCGYYAYNNGYYLYLGWNFSITTHVGIDRYGRNVFYNNEIGYFVFSGNSYISYGFDISNVL